MATFQLPQLQGRIQFSLDGLQGFLLARGEVALQEKANALQHQRRTLGERALLSLAFSGQYSAGKSTIISALTGRSDIHISADVATDEVQAYRDRLAYEKEEMIKWKAKVEDIIKIRTKECSRAEEQIKVLEEEIEQL